MSETVTEPPGHRQRAVRRDHDSGAPARASATGAAPMPVVAGESLGLADPVGTIEAGGRVQRAAASDLLSPPSRGSEVGARIQRAASSGANSVPVPAARISAMAPAGTVHRDFAGAMKSAGRGLANAAKATGKFFEKTGKRVKDTATSIGQKFHRSDFNDLNATQYLVSKGGKIEAINRRVEDDGTVVYYKTGSVDIGEGDRPRIEPYDDPIPMPANWLPSVTHINGMMVKPNSGIGSAIRLQQELENAGEEALLATDVPSVLYTYSAHRGFVTDLAECVWGKLYQDDDATDRQTQIMLDAVKAQQRTTVSAHSRGTIKTDNAVRNAHSQISAGHMQAALQDPAVIALAADAAREAVRQNAGLGLTTAMLEPVYIRLFAREHADKLATQELDQFVQLIYAGNAVQFPSGKVNLNLVVAGSDPVTVGVGKYFGFAKGSKTKMTDVAGGHGFNSNYAPTVAKLIIEDLQRQQHQ